MPKRKYLTLALMIGMLLGYGWQSIFTSIFLRGIYWLVRKLVHLCHWTLEKAKKIVRD